MKRIHDSEGRANVIRVIVKYRGSLYDQERLIKDLVRKQRIYLKLKNLERVEAYALDIQKRKQVVDFLRGEIRYLGEQLQALDSAA
jgi:hypothetical protein